MRKILFSLLSSLLLSFSLTAQTNFLSSELTYSYSDGQEKPEDVSSSVNYYYNGALERAMLINSYSKVEYVYHADVTVNS